MKLPEDTIIEDFVQSLQIMYGRAGRSDMNQMPMQLSTASAFNAGGTKKESHE